MKNAFIIYYSLHKIVEANTDYFKTHRIEFDDGLNDILLIDSLIGRMVIDKEIDTEIKKRVKKLLTYFEYYDMPFEVLFHNQIDDSALVFNKLFDRLDKILKNAESENKILYLATRLKELKKWDINDIQFIEYNLKKDNNYSKRFKRLLSIEMDYINQVKGINPQLPFELTKTVSFSEKFADSFDSLFSKEKATMVLTMLEDLNITSNGVSTLAKRRKSALRGVIDALIETNIAPQVSIELLCNCTAMKIGLQLQSKLDISNTSKLFKKRTLNYLKTNYNK